MATIAALETPDVKIVNRWSEALDQLASIDLIDLCNEAKIERCRATRDLSSCARSVEHVLTSCGHASLCAECSQRCDMCPICRTSIPSNGTRVQLRLYYKCIEAGLIPKKHDDRFQEKEDNGGHLTADIQRLYSLFDVALKNNLVSLICHYVTDVCMDETAVSSDPVLAFLLDEVVVKDWCKQSLNEIISGLQQIYSLEKEEMKSQLSVLQKFVVHLTGISNVLEVMVSSFKDNFPGQLYDLQHLMENTLKAKQHLEVIIWCARHQFLEKVQSRYLNYVSWTSHVLEKKTAAVERAWPDISDCSIESARSHGSLLFIEEALSNLGIEQGYGEETEVDITCLRDRKSPLSFRSKIDEANRNEGLASYPFETVRAAADVLFLRGMSDTVVAKRAIFLYYLFDRHWTRPHQEWIHIVDDFAASFCISRHSLLESLAFYLLDDHLDEAIQEASGLLSEIAGPETHPKIVEVLLEHQRPDVALTVLRCIGRDVFSVYPRSEHDRFQAVTSSEAVAAVRVRIESGLLTEAFTYQRMHCSKVKEIASKNGSSLALSSNYKNGNWLYQVEVLVSEICHLCIRRNLVDRMIELPWNSDEEKFLHESLLKHACQDPSSIHGSLLVVFYLQRYRYVEAYQVNRKLQSLEQKFLETARDDAMCRMQSITHWRTGLVDKSIELLPEVQRQQVMAGSTVGWGLSFSQDVQMSPKSDYINVLPNSATELTPLLTKPSVIHQKTSKLFPSGNILADSPTNFTSISTKIQLESGSKVPSVVQDRLLASLGSPASRMNLVDRIPSFNPYTADNSPSSDIFSRDVKRPDARRRFQSLGPSLPSSFQPGPQSVGSALKVPPNHHQFWGGHGEKADDLVSHERHITRSTPENDVDLMDTSHNGFSKETSHTLYPKVSANQILLTRLRRVTSEEANSNTRSFGKEDSPVEELNMKVGLRWRSDESSGDEMDNMLDKLTGTSPFSVRRRARFSRR